MKINGKWYFNETIKMADGANVFEIVSFEGYYGENPENFLSIYIVKDDNGADTYIYYYTDTEQNEDCQVYQNGWLESNRTIDFGAAYQEVSDEFYNWLTANAKQISKPIPMEHPKGIRLLTKGKKCTEDIEVVPTFSTAPELCEITTSDPYSRIMYTTIDESGKLVIKEMTNDSAKVVKNTAVVCEDPIQLSTGNTNAGIPYGDNAIMIIDNGGHIVLV